MRKLRRTLTRAMVGLMAGVLLAQGSIQATTAQTPRRVTVTIPGFENNLTPFTVSFAALPDTHDLITLVHDTLFWSQNDEQPEPWLAESATPSEDRKLWTVKLRDGVTWHDGVPLTADDIKFTFDYYLKQPGASGRYAHHVSDAPPLERAEVVDRLTTRLTFRAASPTFPILPGGDLPIIPKHVWENVTEPAKATRDLPVGSGPYQVVEIVPDQLYRLKANERYFKGKPSVDELVLPVVKDPTAAFASLRTGQVDSVGLNVPPELMDDFAKLPGLKMVTGTRFESSQLYFNARKAPLSDPRLRKAISLAIDNQALVDTVLLGHGRPGRDSFIHPDSPWALPNVGHEFDVERAKRTLDEAGYNAGADGVRVAPNRDPLEFSVLVSSFAPQDIRVAQLASQQVSRIGVKLNVEALDPATLRQRRAAPPGQVPLYDAYVSGLESHGHVDPDGIYYFFHSPGPKGFGETITGYANSRLDELSEQASMTLDLSARKNLLYEMQRILAQEVPIHVFYYPDGVYAYRPEAYDGWLPDPGHGILTKRSFLPEDVAKSSRSAPANAVAAPAQAVAPGSQADSVTTARWIALGALAVLALGGVGLALARRRRTPEDAE